MHFMYKTPTMNMKRKYKSTASVPYITHNTVAVVTSYLIIFNLPSNPAQLELRINFKYKPQSYLMFFFCV